jgi:hypothetical protein
MIIRVVPEARRELQDAADLYEKQQSGLGRRLWQETDEHIAWIFPYYIAYIVRGNVLWILAIAHSHRRPDYWIDRKQMIG